jgi:hypothetical protein
MSEKGEALVVNTGPLIALAACGGWPVLRGLFKSVVVPETVRQEFLHGSSLPAKGIAEAELPDWMEVLTAGSSPALLLATYLDVGEAEVITLALDRKIGRVAIDEKRGRRVARLFGLSVIGSVGILLQAKREGLIDTIRPSLESMKQAGIWMSKGLWEKAIDAAGEER